MHLQCVVADICVLVYAGHKEIAVSPSGSHPKSILSKVSQNSAAPTIEVNLPIICDLIYIYIYIYIYKIFDLIINVVNTKLMTSNLYSLRLLGLYMAIVSCLFHMHHNTW